MNRNSGTVAPGRRPGGLGYERNSARLRPWTARPLPLRVMVPLALLILPCPLPLRTLARPAAAAEPVPLETAIERALRETARGRVIRGDVEVAQGLYQARRINFFVPSISIRGSLPSYEVDESYRFFGGSPRKRLYKTRGLGMTSFIQLEQNLLTGGKLDVKANLAANEDRYPDTGLSADPGSFLLERSRRSYFDFSVQQPILKPSAPRHELANERDDLELAHLNRREEETLLRREVTEAYLGLLQAQVAESTAVDRLEAARMQAEVDSAKWQDGVIAQEAWLASSSKRLDAELALREALQSVGERRRGLSLLLEEEQVEGIALVEPVPPAHPAAEEVARMRDSWAQSREVLQATHAHAKAKRAAEYAAAGRGLTGDFRASYTVGRGQVRIEGEDEDQIRTNGWGVALDLTYPVWDGGAANAAARSSRFAAEKARLELERAKHAARAEIDRLLDQLDVSRRRLEILAQQVELAGARLGIAEERFRDGRITRIAHLDAKVAVFEARGKYLLELRDYLVNRTELLGRFGD